MKKISLGTLAIALTFAVCLVSNVAPADGSPVSLRR